MGIFKIPGGNVEGEPCSFCVNTATPYFQEFAVGVEVENVRNFPVQLELRTHLHACMYRFKFEFKLQVS
jgi:hypothetical protein